MWSDILISQDFLIVSTKKPLSQFQIFKSATVFLFTGGMEFLSLSIPLWAIVLVAFLAVLLVWQFLRFTLRLLLFFFLFFVLVIALDFLGVFSWISDHIITAFL
ncbi:MAG: hypothetical protein BV458_10235 [Thermoplasmata archaeon M9B2D]|nr:MAG: hypothetical protein BV458_10235 [Thermoplasmata archaeon M9B2D]